MVAEFTVSEVIDGDTFKVKNGWKWDNKTRPTSWVPRLSVPVCVRTHRQATGYNTPEENERGYSPREITSYLTG